MSASGRTSAMTPVGDCLRRPKGRLARLIAQNDRLAHINRVLRAYLPHHLQEHARIVSLGQQHWLLQTDSSAWASRLRYSLPQLQQQLTEHFGDIPPLKLRVQPAPTDDDDPPQRRMRLTQNSADVLTSAAAGVSDQRLGAALIRLAANAARRDADTAPKSATKI